MGGGFFLGGGVGLEACWRGEERVGDCGVGGVGGVGDCGGVGGCGGVGDCDGDGVVGVVRVG